MLLICSLIIYICLHNNSVKRASVCTWRQHTWCKAQSLRLKLHAGAVPPRCVYKELHCLCISVESCVALQLWMRYESEWNIEHLKCHCQGTTLELFGCWVWKTVVYKPQKMELSWIYGKNFQPGRIWRKCSVIIDLAAFIKVNKNKPRAGLAARFC